MSAVTPPRADLRGGNQSEDSFAMLEATFTASGILCLFAGNRRAFQRTGGRKVLNLLTSTRIRATPRGSGVRQTSLSKHGFLSGGVCVRGLREVYRRRSSLSTRLKRYGHEARYRHNTACANPRGSQFVPLMAVRLRRLRPKAYGKTYWQLNSIFLPGGNFRVAGPR